MWHERIGPDDTVQDATNVCSNKRAALERRWLGSIHNTLFSLSLVLPLLFCLLCRVFLRELSVLAAAHRKYYR
jgi:hypothetical protein